MRRTRVAELERRIAELDTFILLASHELVEPLVMIDAYVALVRTGLDSEQHASHREDLDRIARIAGRAKETVEALLSHARYPTEPVRRDPVSLREIMSDCIETMELDLQTRRVKVRVGDLPTVRGDPGLLRIVFQNLLLNALRYGARDGATIAITADRARDEWRISVGSRGPPIAADDLDAIFEPFRRGTAERSGHGVGLGLAICRDLAVRHGGRVELAAADGEGNRFVVALPA